MSREVDRSLLEGPGLRILFPTTWFALGALFLPLLSFLPRVCFLRDVCGEEKTVSALLLRRAIRKCLSAAVVFLPRFGCVVRFLFELS